MKNLLAVFVFLGILMLNDGHAQNSELAKVESKFNSYLQNNFQEKLYIHTDKNSYLCGERMWFKIYNVEAYTNRPVDISKVAYVEILDAENKPVLQCKIALKNGKGEGSLYIPVSMVSGNYSMRSYTNWMKNFNSDYYFHQYISVYNTLKEESNLATKKRDKTCTIQFFPEGGNLVAGLVSKVAFKAVDEYRKGVDFVAVLVNSRNDTVARFKPYKFGIGNFSFKPERGQTYRALIKPDGVHSFSVNLPQIFEEGVVMAINKNAEDKLCVSLQNNTVQNKVFTLFVHSGQKAVFTKTLNGNDSLIVPLNILGNGISHFTLFDKNENPLCERLYFKKPLNLLMLDLSVDKRSYRSREKVQLSVSQKNIDLSGETDFSVSVYKSDDHTTTENIATNLWLTSELKGKIENADWYLKNAPSEAVDNLMLTHGWRRFKWENVLKLNKPQFEYLPEVEGHIITGRVISSVNNSPLANRIGFLSVPGKQFQLYTSSSNNKGEVNFYTKNFYGSHELIAQLDFRIDSLSYLEINSPYSDQFADLEMPIFVNAFQPDDLLARSVAMQVNNAYFSKYLKKKVVPFTDSLSFYEKPNKVYKLDDYIRFTTMEEVLREYVSEVMVTIKNKDYHLNIFDDGIAQFHNGSPFILIDGVPIFDDGKSILKMDPRKIQRLEIVSSIYMYGRNTFPGIASFRSYKGNLSDYQLPKKALVIDYDGIQNAREFYLPMYEEDIASDRIPDYRTTLFWSPNNQLNKDGVSNLSFVTSDLEGEYLVQVQALSKTGMVATANTGFKISKTRTN